MIVQLTRSQYKAMLNSGVVFRNWSLYEPMHNPQKTFYLVRDERGNVILHKTKANYDKEPTR